MNLHEDLVARVDEYASRMSINRSSAVSVLISQALDTQQAMTDMNELLKLIKENKE